MAEGTLTGKAYGKPHGILYCFTVANRTMMGIQDLRTTLSSLIKGIGKTRQHVLVTNRGQVAAVIVPLDWYRDAASKLGDPFDITVPVAQIRE